MKFEIDKAVEEMNQRMVEIDSIEDKKEWFIAYKSIIDEYSYIIDPPETIYDCFTEEELDLLFRVVQAEVGDEYSFKQKVNVADVIFNRLEHERFPDTLLETLTADQFQPISNGSYKSVEVSEDTILACEYAFQIGTDTEKCLFFDSNNTLNYEFVWNDGAHNFYKYRGGKIRVNTRLIINLNDFTKARKFINETTKFPSDIDVIRDRYVIDGKSAIGIFTLDLSKPVEVQIHSEDPYEIKRFNDIMSEFV